VIAPNGEPDRFLVAGGVPYFQSDETGSLVRHRLVEISPNLFLADNGETLDLRGPSPTWRSFGLVRVTGGPDGWQWVLLGTAALLAAAWLVATAVRVVRRRMSGSASDGRTTASRRWRRIAAFAALITSVLTLANVALLVWMPTLVDSGFLGWLDLPTAQRMMTHLPLALVVLSGCTLVLVAAGWGLRWWSNALRLQYVVLAVAAVAVVAQLAAWRLIGWGVSL
jgi:hypothetical protein